MIWDEVVHRIVNEVLNLSRTDETPLHFNLREDMAFELAQLQSWLCDCVVDRQTAGRDLPAISVPQERQACLGPEGASIISGTACVVCDRIWSRKMEERWKPKSAKALERDTSPRRATLPIKAVGKSHFIPRWFIRDLWAVDGKVLRWRRTADGWSSASRGFAEWGYRQHLYSGRLEAYFSLLEGDAKRPIEMLLDTRPLNGPQRNAFVGFLIIQLLRNPSFIEFLHNGIAPVLAELGHADDPTMPHKAYESMFGNHDLYHQLAHPVMWSRWLIVRSKAPIFVLPDTFGIRGLTVDGLRLIAPITPTACFITLPDRESEPRVVPRHLPADASLARRISSALVYGAVKEFLSHPDFQPDLVESEPFEALLGTIAQAVAKRTADEA